ncbi:MAG: nucleotidyltransferase domain-containing protein [Actinomycetota bacterium]
MDCAYNQVTVRATILDIQPEATTHPIDALATRLQADWPAIQAAREATLRQHARLAEVLADLASEDTSIVVFGSLARDEFTIGSDIDWTLLVDGIADPRHLDSAIEIHRHVCEVEGREPGREGTFGGLTFSHDLIHTIGGGDDTNRNMTLRILMLLESAVIGRRDAYDRVVKNILQRYIDEDYGLLYGRSPRNVPRFLQNDIARYWRTVAIDFAYKQRSRSNEQWALKTLKLRMSRKLTYAAGLLLCFGCHTTAHEVPEASRDVAELSRRMQAHLWETLQATPMEIIASFFLGRPEADEIAGQLFGSYNRFLAMLNDAGIRGHFKQLAREDADADALYGEGREIGHTFQAALTGLFFGETTGIADLTKIYGVF